MIPPSASFLVRPLVTSMHDEALPHRTKAAKSFLKEKVCWIGRAIPPELNPIENSWDLL